MPGIPSEDACFFGGTPRNYALTIDLYANIGGVSDVADVLANDAGMMKPLPRRWLFLHPACHLQAAR